MQSKVIPFPPISDAGAGVLHIMQVSGSAVLSVDGNYFLGNEQIVAVVVHELLAGAWIAFAHSHGGFWLTPLADRWLDEQAAG